MRRWLWPAVGCAVIIWIAVVVNVGCGTPSVTVTTKVEPTVTQAP